jgi:hypothetical protein
LTNATYEARLVSRSLTDALTVNTFAATLAAVSLSYTNAGGGGFFPATTCTAAATTNSATVWTAITNLQCQLLHTATIDVISVLSLAGKTAVGTKNTGEYRLAMTNSTGPVQQSVDVERYFEGGDDWGSVGMVSVFTNIADGTTTLSAEQRHSGGATLTDYPRLVAFSSISEHIFNPPPAPSITGIWFANVTNLVLSWTSASNAVYGIVMATNLLDASPWSEYATNIPTTPVLNVYTGAVSTNKVVFYRIEASAE